MTTRTREKKCFSIVHCSLHAKCGRAHADWRNGYFDPQTVGEHCSHFIPLEQIMRGKIIPHNHGEVND